MYLKPFDNRVYSIHISGKDRWHIIQDFLNYEALLFAGQYRAEVYSFHLLFPWADQEVQLEILSIHCAIRHQLNPKAIAQAVEVLYVTRQYQGQDYAPSKTFRWSYRDLIIIYHCCRVKNVY